MTFLDQTTPLHTFGSPYCQFGGDSELVKDKLVADPILVLDQVHGVLSVVTTDFGSEMKVNHSLTIAHRKLSNASTFDPLNPSTWTIPIMKWDFEHREFPNSSEVFNSVVGAGALLHNDPTAATTGLDIFAIRSNGVLMQALSTSNANAANWRNCMPVTVDKCADPSEAPDRISKLCPAQRVGAGAPMRAASIGSPTARTFPATLR